MSQNTKAIRASDHQRFFQNNDAPHVVKGFFGQERERGLFFRPP